MINKKKKESIYNLSENSKKSNADFKSANQLASAIYAVFKKLLDRSASRNQYQRLNKLIIKILHSDSKDFLGKRKLYQGNVTLLKGFRLNPYTRWDSLIHVQPLIIVSPVDKTLNIHLPVIEAKDVVVPPRASKLVLQFACCEVDADSISVNTHISAKLILPLEQNIVLSKAKRMSMHLPEMEGKILLVTLIIRTYLYDNYGHDQHTPAEFLSNDRKYYAGEILEVFYVKDGYLVTYEENKTEKLRPLNDFIDREDVQWEDE